VKEEFSPVKEVYKSPRIDQVYPLEITEGGIECVGLHESAGIRVFCPGDAVTTASVARAGNIKADLFERHPTTRLYNRR
jgi:hypothetical protein